MYEHLEKIICLTEDIGKPKIKEYTYKQGYKLGWVRLLCAFRRNLGQ